MRPETVLADLDRLSAELESHLAPLSAQQWRTPTPAAGWDVAAQVAHLAWTDEAAVAAATDKARWDALVGEVLADPEHVVHETALAGGRAEPEDVLLRWKASRTALNHALQAVPARETMPWFGPPMSPTSMATARFMETWAHGLDVYDALGIAVEHSDRIRHVAHLGVRTRDFAFTLHDLDPPGEPFRIELIAPSGEHWGWGPDNAPQRVTGSALDFCMLVTQRTHRDDTDLVAVGPDAGRWLAIAQCFAGRPGPGRQASG